MNLFKKSIYALSLVGMTGLWSCSQEEMLSSGAENTVKGQPVQLTLTVTRGDTRTRTVLSEDTQNGGLISEWAAGDYLYVYDTNGNQVGKLELQSEPKSPKGVFSGEITAEEGTHYYNFWYYDEENDLISVEKDGNGNRLTVNLSKQNFFSPEDLSAMEILSSRPTDEYEDVEILVKDGKATVMKDVTLVPKLAMARFSLKNLPTNSKGTLNIYNVGDPLPIQDGFGFVSTYSEHKESNAAGITIENVEADKDVFVAFIPSPEYKLGFTFTTSDGKVYKYQFEKFTELKGGVYYTAFDKDGDKTDVIPGIPVVFGEDGDDELVGPIFEVEGKKFRFTRANLQYNTQTSTWSIPKKQTEYVGKSGRRFLKSAATSNPDVVDLFGWGATGVEDQVYQPRPADFWKEQSYNTNSYNTIDGQYPSANTSQNATLNTNSTLCPGGTMQDTPFDWGQAYGNTHSGHFYTLTSNEMSKVIDGYCVVLGTVEGVQGAILTNYTTVDGLKEKLDEMEVSYTKSTLYKLPSKNSSKPNFAWDRLSISYDQLTELDGVFFPAAGMRNPGVDTDYGSVGYYWTATVSTTPNAIAWVFDGQKTQNNRIFNVYGRGKGQGMAVRLVKEIVSNTDTDETVGKDL